MDKTKMLKELRATRFPKNKGRTNILNKGQTYSLSMVLGKVRQLYSSCNGKVCKVDSKWNKKYPELLKAAKQLLKQHDPKYRFEAVTINKNQKAHSHTDVNNVGHSYIIGLGDYTGGELVFTDKDSPYYGTHNIKNKWLKFVGDTPHHVRPFKGERYTLVYYHWK
jgi:hypothetical protein